MPLPPSLRLATATLHAASKAAAGGRVDVHVLGISHISAESTEQVSATTLQSCAALCRLPVAQRRMYIVLSQCTSRCHSNAQVAQLIHLVQPDTMFLELCTDRTHLLWDTSRQPSRWHTLNVRAYSSFAVSLLSDLLHLTI